MFLISFISASAGSVFWTSMIADMVPAKVRGRYFGIRNTIHWAFASLSLLASGLILEHSSQRGGFLILYAVSAICIVWNTYELLNYPNPPFEKSIASSRAGMLLKPFKDPEFMKATSFLSLFILIQNIAVPLFSFAMLSVLKISYLWVTVITSVQMVVMMISYYFWGNLNTRYASKTLLMWCLPLIAAACLLWAGMEVLPLLLVLIVVHILLGIGTGGYNLLAFNFMIGDTPKTERPMYIAIFSALTGFTGFIGPLVGGTIYNIIEEGPFWLKSYGVSFLTGAALLALAAGVGPFVLRSAKKKVT
jgi:MFS family permease